MKQKKTFWLVQFRIIKHVIRMKKERKKNILQEENINEKKKKKDHNAHAPKPKSEPSPPKRTDPND